jgi:SSS family solute:Na+ symporter
MPTPFLEFVDYIIMAIYILFVVWLGIFLSRQSYTTEKDYFLAGRSLRWPVVGVSLFATNIGAISLIGLAESGYTTGFAVFSYEWMAVIVLIILAIFYLPLYLKSEVYTIPEFLEKRYGSFARYYFSAVTIFLNTFVDIAAGLFAGAILLKMVFPDVSISTIIWGISVIAALYTLFGGLSTVVYSDIIQAMLMVFSSMFLAVIAYEEVGGWSEIIKRIDPQNLNIIRPMDDPTLPWTGLFGVLLLYS